MSGGSEPSRGEASVRGARGVPAALRASLVALLLTGCGSSELTTLPPATPTPGPEKPAAASDAVMEAIARTAAFSDVTYQRQAVVVSGGVTSQSTGTVTATQHPPRLEFVASTAGGPVIDTVEDLAAGTVCTGPKGGARKRFTGGTAPVGAVDPFYELQTEGRNWRYLPGTIVAGHAAWVVEGDVARTFAAATVDSSTAVVTIDSQSQRIIEDVEQVTTTAGVTQSQSTTTLTGFAYDTGASIPGC